SWRNTSAAIPRPIARPRPPGLREACRMGADGIGSDLPQAYNAAELLFGNLAAGRGDKVAVVCRDQRLTYAELCALAGRAGNGLRALGLETGDRVLFLLHDTPVFVAAFFGAVASGFVPMLVNT